MPPTLLRQLRRRLDAWRFRHRLAICAIFKDEAPYLAEWLAFHERVGVAHFYLYDNGSSDGFRGVLAPWIAAGKVTLVDWPGAGAQLAAYDHCLRRARREARWLAFIDIDEFLFAPDGAALPDALEAYRDLPAVFVYWRLYGSSGHQARPSGPVIEAYTWRLDDEGSERLLPTGTTGQPRQGKSVVNPRRVREMGVHLPVKPRKGVRDERRRAPPRDPEDRAATITCERLRINHYWSKSIQDLREKAARGRASVDKQRNLEAMLAWERELNAVEDRTILAFPRRSVTSPARYRSARHWPRWR